MIRYDNATKIDNIKKTNYVFNSIIKYIELLELDTHIVRDQIMWKIWEIFYEWQCMRTYMNHIYENIHESDLWVVSMSQIYESYRWVRFMRPSMRTYMSQVYGTIYENIHESGLWDHLWEHTWVRFMRPSMRTYMSQIYENIHESDLWEHTWVRFMRTSMIQIYENIC
jgi:hypothetical protein